MSTVADFADVIERRGAKVTLGVVNATNDAAKAAADEVKRTARRVRLTGRSGRKVPLGASVTKAREFRRTDAKRPNAVAIVKATPAGFWAIVDRGRRGGYTIRPRGYGGSLRGLRGRARRQAALDQAFGGAGQYRGLKPLRTPYGPRYSVQPGPARAIDANLWDRSVDRARPVARKAYDGALRDQLLDAARRPVIVVVRAGR